MFKEPRYKGGFDQIITAQRILELCPWLWAFRQLWAEGWACESGSIHNPALDIQGTIFEQDADDLDHVYYHMVKNGIHSVHKLEPRKIFKTDEFMEYQDNPQCRGTNIAERIVHSIGLPLSALWAMSLDHKIRIEQVVVETGGPGDRSEHFYIYRDNLDPNGGVLLRNLLEDMLLVVNEENVRP